MSMSSRLVNSINPLTSWNPLTSLSAVDGFQDYSSPTEAAGRVTTEVTMATIDNAGLPLDPMSLATALALENVVQIGILPVVTLCGMVMNVINMMVFYRQGLSDRINLCLFSLALSDTGYISLLMTTRLYSTFNLLDPALGEFWKVWTFRLAGVYSGFLNVSNCLTVLISLDRCVCVTMPLKARTIMSTRRMAVIIISVFIVTLSSCFMALCFRFGLRSYADPVSGVTRYALKPTTFYNEYRDLVEVVGNVIFNFSVPTISLAIVVAATAVISVRMRTVLEWRKQTAHVGTNQASSSSSPDQRREAAVTRMLVSVCLMYSFCTTPYVLHTFCRQFVDQFVANGSLRTTFYATIAIAHLMTTINSSANFVIFWFHSTKFRQTLKSMGCGQGKAGLLKKYDQTEATETTQTTG